MAFDFGEVLGNVVEGLMKTTEAIQVIGEPVQAGDKLIIPAVVARIGFGAGGGSGKSDGDEDDEAQEGGAGSAANPPPPGAKHSEAGGRGGGGGAPGPGGRGAWGGGGVGGGARPPPPPHAAGANNSEAGVSGRRGGESGAGGGGGGGVALTPVFLIVDEDGERLLTVPGPLQSACTVVERVKSTLDSVLPRKSDDEDAPDDE